MHNGLPVRYRKPTRRKNSKIPIIIMIIIILALLIGGYFVHTKYINNDNSETEDVVKDDEIQEDKTEEKDNENISEVQESEVVESDSEDEEVELTEPEEKFDTETETASEVNEPQGNSNDAPVQTPQGADAQQSSDTSSVGNNPEITGPTEGNPPAENLNEGNNNVVN